MAAAIRPPRCNGHVELRANAAAEEAPRIEQETPQIEPQAPPPQPPETPQPHPAGASFQIAFYRKYTEALLRRYMRMSLEAGRVPSLLGREMFRGNVTHYRVHTFEDVVIFCHDVEKRLAQLSPLDQKLVNRIGLQRYTRPETALMLGLDVNRTVRRYLKVLDQLTKVFLKDRLLEPQFCCQER